MQRDLSQYLNIVYLKIDTILNMLTVRLSREKKMENKDLSSL